MSRVSCSLNQGFVVSVTKSDRRDLIDADLVGVKRSRNCIEDLTSASEDDWLSVSDDDDDNDHDDDY